MKVLVTAASRHGSTTEIARAIGAALEAAGMPCDVLPIAEVQGIDSYDAVVLGSAVYVGKWLDEAKAFAERHADGLRQRPVWLFSSGPLGDPPKPSEDPVDAKPMLELTGAREHRLLAGALVKDRLGFGERAIVKMVRAPYGDFRAWDAVVAWSGEIAQYLKTAPLAASAQTR